MTLEKMFRVCGRNVQLCSLDESWQSEIYNAFVQPLRYKNKMYLDDLHLDAGVEDMGYYLYIGPKEHDLTALLPQHGFLKTADVKYSIIKSEKVYYADDVLYIWAILRTAVVE